MRFQQFFLMDKSITYNGYNLWEFWVLYCFFQVHTKMDTFFRSLIFFFYNFFSSFFQVFVGSASEGLLMAGDKVVGINHQGSNFVF